MGKQMNFRAMPFPEESYSWMVSKATRKVHIAGEDGYPICGPANKKIFNPDRYRYGVVTVPISEVTCKQCTWNVRQQGWWKSKEFQTVKAAREGRLFV